MPRLVAVSNRVADPRNVAAGGLAVAAGPIAFNETGDNRNASTAMIQILGQKPVVVWPKDAAEQKLVLPRPKR